MHTFTKLGLILCWCALTSAAAQTRDGACELTSYVPGMPVPPSDLWSPEFLEYAQSMVPPRLNPSLPFFLRAPAKDAARSAWERFDAQNDSFLEKYLQKSLTEYSVDIVDTRIGEVPVSSVSPKGGLSARNRNRVLINLHGGGFVQFRGVKWGLLESIPVAALGKMKVITVDYRQAPWHTYPAASEDVETVYRELLKQYEAEAIGIFGCSAGGKLVSQATAWILAKGLPRPGAVGIFCSAPLGHAAGKGGDSATLWIPANAKAVMAPAWYMQDANPNDPVAYPGSSDAVLAKFPATLLLTGTRAYDMSGTIVAHSKLLKLGVDSQLYVLEGGWHGAHVMAAGTPEAHDANAYIARWFDEHLSSKADSLSVPPTLEERLRAEVDKFVAADKLTPPDPCQLLFVGSSTFAFWKSLQDDMAPLRVINRGFGGSHIEDVNHWFEQIVAPYRPSAIVFYAGENDIAAGKPVERVVADFDTFMKLKDEALGEVPVYFISLKPSKARIEQIERQAAVNRAIRARADARADLHYIDVATTMLQDGRPKDIFLEDGLHMRRGGYETWTRVIRAALMPNARLAANTCRRKPA